MLTDVLFSALTTIYSVNYALSSEHLLSYEKHLVWLANTNTNAGNASISLVSAKVSIEYCYLKLQWTAFDWIFKLESLNDLNFNNLKFKWFKISFYKRLQKINLLFVSRQWIILHITIPIGRYTLNYVIALTENT